MIREFPGAGDKQPINQKWYLLAGAVLLAFICYNAETADKLTVKRPDFVTRVKELA